MDKQNEGISFGTCVFLALTVIAIILSVAGYIYVNNKFSSPTMEAVTVNKLPDTTSNIVASPVTISVGSIISKTTPICYLKERNEAITFTTPIAIWGVEDFPDNKISINNYFSISPIGSNEIIYHFYDYYNGYSDLLSKNIVFNNISVLDVYGGEVQCIINCPNKNSPEGCEIGICPKYDSSCISVIMYSSKDPYSFGYIQNNCDTPLKAKIYLNYTVIDEECR